MEQQRLTAAEYRAQFGKPGTGVTARTTPSGKKVPHPATKKQKPSTRDHLVSMGAYFVEQSDLGKPITQKSVDFYIRQSEMSGDL